MLSIAEKVASLKNAESFRNASNEDLERIAALTQEVQLADGETLFKTGDKGDAIYFIFRGQVRVYRSGVDLAVLKQGECVGEVAVIDEGPRSASISSLGNSLLLKLNRNDYYNVLQGNANLLENILKITLGKLREHTDKEINAVSNQIRMEQDLLRAREMQMSMIPKQDLYIANAGCASIYASGFCHPADKVGGDYYDYFPLPDNQAGIVMGDVEGHGFHTGLMVAMAKSCLQMQIKANYSIQKVMEAMNDMAYGFMEGGMSMSFCYIIFDLKDRILSFSNAGHRYPYHYCYNKRDLRLMESDAFPLGWFESQDYSITQWEWEENDIFVLYTDGIIEARNGKDDEFGEDRLKELIIKNACISPSKLKEAILEEYRSFCGDMDQEDDVSLLIVKTGECVR